MVFTESFLDDGPLKTCNVKNTLHAYTNERLQFILVKFLVSQQWKETNFEPFRIFQYPVYEMDECRQIMSTLIEFFLFNRLT